MAQIYRLVEGIAKLAKVDPNPETKTSARNRILKMLYQQR